ncbi:DUF2254 domain-containing protein [Euzebya tangerina]|uniref:DUF2254 domain-containing protein n=1 Tax=Euzebya tangerina TaxID=591198 RepID=UPI0013C307D7|nr:DUF2254 domain-containing protein [Euzebya tangerina]
MSSSSPNNDGGVGLLRLRGASARFRESLFFLPAIFVVSAVALAVVMTQLDQLLVDTALPAYFSTTVDNSRSILSTIAGGTIGAASIVFSLTLVAVQLAASQFSPRVVRGFLGDRFQQIVIGIVVGTFTYSLLVLRVVQDPSDATDVQAYLPRLSVLLAVVLAVASLLAVLGSIDHTAKALRVGSLLDKVAAETVRAIRSRFERLDEDGERALVVDAPVGITSQARSADDIPNVAHELRADRVGWVTQISIDGLVQALPRGAVVRLVTPVGHYVTPHALLAYVWSDDELDWPDLRPKLQDVIEVRATRTLQQDVPFGLLQLTDIAVRALSPGVNDPNTAIESVARTGGVLGVLLQHDIGERVLTQDRRRVERGWHLSTSQYVEAAIEPIRRYGASDPVVLRAIIRTLRQALASAEAGCEMAIDASGIDDQLDRIRANLDGLPDAGSRAVVEDELDAHDT